MAQTKKKITRKKSGGTRSSSSAGQRKNKDIKQVKLQLEVTLLVTFALCVLLFLCNFGIIGTVGNFFSNIMKGLFGMTAYIFPILLFGLVILMVRESGNPSTFRKVKNYISLFLLFLSFLGLVELINGISRSLEKYNISEIYNYGINEVRGAGLFAATLDYLMLKGLGVPGTIIIELIIIVLALIFFTEGGVLDTTKKSFISIKESLDSEKEAKQELYENRQKQNQERMLDRQEKQKQKKAIMENITDTATINPDSSKKEAVEDSVASPSVDEKPVFDKKEIRDDKKIIGLSKKPQKLKGVTEDTIIVKPNVSPEEAGDIHEITVNGFNEIDLSFDDSAFCAQAEVAAVASVGTVHEITKDFSSVTNNTNALEESRSDYHDTSVQVQKSAPVTEIKKPTNTVANVPTKPVSNKYVPPSIELLTKNKNLSSGDSQEVLNETATKLVDTLKIFGVDVHVESISKGPTVTRYELQPAPGTKVSKIKGLTDDIKLSLATADIRIEAPVPGKSVIGIEVPNKEAIPVLFRDIAESPAFKKETNSNLTFGVGKDIGGNVIVYDIDQFPHLLVAGATGSGKSVCINTLIMSIIYKCHPNDVKMIMIDPKVVELRVYDGIPHLLFPVVTDAKKAAIALNAAVNEMMDRYRKFAEVNVRDLKGYNSYCDEQIANGESPDLFKKLPRLIIIVDELADLMMVAKNEVEDSICRLAQLARACGIHLIVATQRPSVDVITGLIKANMPSRLAFAVSSGVDSRTILDMVGAEELLGKGDMLFFPKGLKKPIRLQGAFISDHDVNEVVKYLKDNPVQCDELTDSFKNIDNMELASAHGSKNSGSASASDNPEFDELFMDVAYYIIDSNKASIGNLQRKFKIGFNRAARIMDTLAEHGVVSGEDGTKGRQVLMNREEFENYVEENGL